MHWKADWSESVVCAHHLHINEEEDFCEEVASIGAKYNGVFNAGFEDLHIVAVDMINFVFASPLYEGDLYVHDKSDEGKGNVLVATPSKTEMEKYAEFPIQKFQFLLKAVHKIAPLYFLYFS